MSTMALTIGVNSRAKNSAKVQRRSSASLQMSSCTALSEPFGRAKPGAEFEIEERSATDVADDLDNEVRLSVFDELKDRLCEEIWLEEHEEPAEVAELGLAVAGRDSKVPTPTPPPGSAAASAGSASIQPGIRAADRILPPRDVERADGVTGWQADRPRHAAASVWR